MELNFNVLLRIKVECENFQHGKEVILKHPPEWEVIGTGYSDILKKQHGGGEWPAGYKISKPKILKIE